MKTSVFLSYRRGVSADLARWLRDNLHQLGVDVFFDVESINAGRFANIIEREIQRRDYFVVLLTPETLESEWVRKEIQIALAARKNIVPITTQGFAFGNLPPEIAELAQYSGIPYQYEYAEHEYACAPDNGGVVVGIRLANIVCNMSCTGPNDLV